MTAEVLRDDPDYERTARLDELRRTEYGYLDEQDHVYLDYAGAGLAARSQHRAHHRRVAGTVFGGPASEASTQLVDWTRERVLRHLNADPAEYVVIFTPNATGAARLVGASYQFSRRARLVLTADNHDSVTGLREFAGQRTTEIPVRAADLRVDAGQLTTELTRGRRGLFAYPAQSNVSGVRHPLEWVDLARGLGYDVLLDAAAYLPTARLDLAAVRPDFVMVSWYKVFGYPSGVGCLVARRAALTKLARPRLEDSTLNFLSIPDVYFGLDWLDEVDLDLVATRVRCLTAWSLNRLSSLRHTDGGPMAEVHGPRDTEARGGTVAFSLLDRDGRAIDERVVATEAAAARISLSTGRLPQHGRGAIRVSFGLASTVEDVERLIVFAQDAASTR